MSMVVAKFAGKLLVSFIHVQFYYIIWHDFQAQPISAELAAKLLGNRVAVSPIVTVEPRRRKFHKPITLTIPVPQAANKGMINQYSGDAPTLRLLCSITGEYGVSFTTSCKEKEAWWAYALQVICRVVLWCFKPHNLRMKGLSI